MIFLTLLDISIENPNKRLGLDTTISNAKPLNLNQKLNSTVAINSSTFRIVQIAEEISERLQAGKQFSHYTMNNKGQLVHQKKKKIRKNHRIPDFIEYDDDELGEDPSDPIGKFKVDENNLDCFFICSGNLDFLRQNKDSIFLKTFGRIISQKNTGQIKKQKTVKSNLVASKKIKNLIPYKSFERSLQINSKINRSAPNELKKPKKKNSFKFPYNSKKNDSFVLLNKMNKGEVFFRKAFKKTPLDPGEIASLQGGSKNLKLLKKSIEDFTVNSYRTFTGSVKKVNYIPKFSKFESKDLAFEKNKK